MSKYRPNPKLRRKIEKLLEMSGDPQLVIVAKNFKSGFNLVLKAFDAMELAQKISLPKGVAIKDISFENTSPAKEGTIIAANWILRILKERLSAEEWS